MHMKKSKFDLSAFRRAALVLSAFAVLAVAGCASDYNRYATTSADMAKATEATKAQRFTALGSLGCTTTYRFNDKGDKVTHQEVKCDPEAAKFAAFALAISGMQTAQEQVAKIEAPYTLGQAIRDVGGLIVPLANVGAQIYGIQKNASVAITQSNNATALGISTNNTMSGIAGSGFAAAGNIAANGFATATTLGSRVTNVTNVTGNGNAVNGSTTDNSSTANTNNCASGDGGTGTPATTASNIGSSSASTVGANASQSSGGTTGAQSGNTRCVAGK